MAELVQIEQDENIGKIDNNPHLAGDQGISNISDDNNEEQKSQEQANNQEEAKQNDEQQQEKQDENQQQQNQGNNPSNPGQISITIGNGNTITINQGGQQQNQQVDPNQSQQQQQQEGTVQNTQEQSMTAEMKQQQKDQEEFQKKYDPLKRPPNIDEARDNARSYKIGKPNIKDGQINPYSGLPQNVEPFSVCCPNDELAELGAAYPLYFQYVKFCCFLLFLMSIVVGIQSFLNNKEGTRCQDNENNLVNKCVTSPIILYSWANRNQNYDPVPQYVLSIIFVVLSVISLLVLRNYQQKLADKVDRNMVTPSDYTVIVKGLPKDEKEEDIKQFFIDYGKEKTEAKVKKVVMAYKIGPYIELQREKNRLEMQIREKKAQMEDNEEDNQEAIDKLNEEEEEIKDQIKEMEEKMQNVSEFEFTGTAFVSFHHDRDCQKVQEKWEFGDVESFIYRIVTACGCRLKKTYKGKLIHVSRAPEPLDVFWENLGYSFKKLLKKKAYTNLWSLLLMGACFGAILGLKAGQEQVAQQNREEDVGALSARGAGATILSLLASALIVIINGVLGLFVRRFARYEKPDTYTDYFISTAWKLGFALFINTALVTLFVEMIITQRTGALYSDDSMVYDVFYLSILNAFVPDLANIFNPVYYFRKWKQRKIIQQGAACKLRQHQANSWFEPPPYDIAQRYANVQKTMLFVGFYANLIPVGIFINFVGLILSYHVDKILLIKRHKRPHPLGPELSDSMARFLELFLVSFTVGNLVFEGFIRGTTSPANFGVMIFTIVVFYIPSSWVGKCLFKSSDTITTSKTHDEAALDFVSDYDRANPMYQEKAQKEWFDMIASLATGQEKDDLANLRKQLFQSTNQGGPLSNMRNYANNRLGFSQMSQMNYGIGMRGTQGMMGPMQMRGPMMANPMMFGRRPPGFMPPQMMGGGMMAPSIGGMPQQQPRMVTIQTPNGPRQVPLMSGPMMMGGRMPIGMPILGGPPQSGFRPGFNQAPPPNQSQFTGPPPNQSGFHPPINQQPPSHIQPANSQFKPPQQQQPQFPPISNQQGPPSNSQGSQGNNNNSNPSPHIQSSSNQGGNPMYQQPGGFNRGGPPPLMNNNNNSSFRPQGGFNPGFQPPPQGGFQGPPPQFQQGNPNFRPPQQGGNFQPMYGPPPNQGIYQPNRNFQGGGMGALHKQ